MQHGIPEQQWMEFLDGSLEAAGRERILRHLEGCADCSKLAVELDTWRDALRREGGRLREASRLPDAQIDFLLAEAMERIRQARPARARAITGWTVAEGITVLRFLMEPILGPGTAQAAIDLAVHRSADDGSRVVERNWRLFVGNLSDATALICGLAAGRLVDRAGLCLAIEEG